LWTTRPSGGSPRPSLGGLPGGAFPGGPSLGGLPAAIPAASLGPSPSGCRVGLRQVIAVCGSCLAPQLAISHMVIASCGATRPTITDIP
jgi:hypothetical protein